jgi:hypothetical protein
MDDESVKNRMYLKLLAKLRKMSLSFAKWSGSLWKRNSVQNTGLVWIMCLQDERDVADNERSGHLTTITTDPNVEKITEVVRNDY